MLNCTGTEHYKIFDLCYNAHIYFYINILVKKVRVIVEVLRQLTRSRANPTTLRMFHFHCTLYTMRKNW